MNNQPNLFSRCFLRRPKAFAISIIIFVALIAFTNSLPNSFHFDDMVGVAQNPTLRDLRNIPSFFTDPSTFGLGPARDWRPILQISYALNYFLAGPNPTVFRVFNLLFHVGTAFFLFLVIAEIFRHTPIRLAEARPELQPGLALLASLLFLVHTANSDAVDYIWARSSVLAAFFYLLGFYCFLRGPFSVTDERKLPWHVAGLAIFFLGVGTKATVVTLPASLLVYEFLFLNSSALGPVNLFRQEPRRFKKYVPIAVVLVGYIAMRTLLLVKMAPGLRGTVVITSSTYLFTQFRAWVYYLRLFLWPHPLIGDYSGFGWSRSLWDATVLLSLGSILGILALGWRARRSHPHVAFFTFWFFIALLPESGFVPLMDPVVGYRPYLAYAGLSVVFILVNLIVWNWLWTKVTPSQRHGSFSWPSYAAVMGIILAALTGATVVRNLDWRDPVTMWNDVLTKSPKNARAFVGLGNYFLNRREFEKAQEMFDKSLRTDPHDAEAFALRGYVKAVQKKYPEALKDYDAAIRLSPRAPFPYAYRGDLYNRTGELEKALADFHQAIALFPYYADAYFGLALAYIGKEQVVEATQACAKVVEIDIRDQRGYDCLGALLMEQNRLTEAIKVYEQGTARIPEDGDLWRGLGNAYEKIGMPDAAERAFTKANLLTRDLKRPEP